MITLHDITRIGPMSALLGKSLTTRDKLNLSLINKDHNKKETFMYKHFNDEMKSLKYFYEIEKKKEEKRKRNKDRKEKERRDIREWLHQIQETKINELKRREERKRRKKLRKRKIKHEQQLKRMYDMYQKDNYMGYSQSDNPYSST